MLLRNLRYLTYFWLMDFNLYLGEGGQEALEDLASVSLTTSLSTNALSFVSKTVLYFESGSSDSSSRKSLLFMGETSGHGDSFLFWEICNIELFSGELSLKYVLRMSSKMSWGEDVDDEGSEYEEDGKEDEVDEMFLILTQ